MEEIQKLYDVLVRDGYYTKSLDDFIVQYQDPAYVDKVFEVVTRDGLYTKDRETFDTQFSIKKKRTNNRKKNQIRFQNWSLVFRNYQVVKKILCLKEHLVKTL